MVGCRVAAAAVGKLDLVEVIEDPVIVGAEPQSPSVD